MGQGSPSHPSRSAPSPGRPAWRRSQGPGPGVRAAVSRGRGWGGGAGGPRRPPAFPVPARSAVPPGPARHREAAPAAPHLPAAGARPAGSRNRDAASNGPGPLRAGVRAAQRSAAPPPAAAPAEQKGSSLLAAPGINARSCWLRLDVPLAPTKRALGSAAGHLCRRPEALPGGPVCPGRRRLLDVPREGTRGMLNV